MLSEVIRCWEPNGGVSVRRQAAVSFHDTYSNKNTNFGDIFQVCITTNAQSSHFSTTPTLTFKHFEKLFNHLRILRMPVCIAGNINWIELCNTKKCKSLFRETELLIVSEVPRCEKRRGSHGRLRRTVLVNLRD